MTRTIFILECFLNNLCVRINIKSVKTRHKIRVHSLINTLVEADFSEVSRQVMGKCYS